MKIMFTTIKKYVNDMPIERLWDGLCINDGQIVGIEVADNAEEQWIEFCIAILPHIEALRELGIKHGIEPSYIIHRGFISMCDTKNTLNQLTWVEGYDDYTAEFYGAASKITKKGDTYEQTKE